MRQKMQIRFAVSSIDSVLILGQPVPALTL